MFNVGDRVRLVKGSMPYLGLEGVVTSTTEKTHYVIVDNPWRNLIAGPADKGEHPWHFNKGMWTFELIDEPVEPEDWS